VVFLLCSCSIYFCSSFSWSQRPRTCFARCSFLVDIVLVRVLLVLIHLDVVLLDCVSVFFVVDDDDDDDERDDVAAAEAVRLRVCVCVCLCVRMNRLALHAARGMNRY